MARAIVDHISPARATSAACGCPARAFRYTGPYYDMLARVAAVVVGRSELTFRLDGALGSIRPLADRARPPPARCRQA